MNDPDNFEGEELVDVEPFEGKPIYLQPVTLDGDQDDEAPENDGPEGSFVPREIAGLMTRVTSGPNTWQETLAWYRSHHTKAEIGFDPDAMCLKICRTARNIPARFLTARAAMLSTPGEHRIHKVRDLRRGMVAYYADPRDSNDADHIVGVIGRVKGFNPDLLSDVLMVTNSVQVDRLTVVRGTYFEDHWGDDFKFGATWLNGFELDVPNHGTKVERFHDTAPEYNLRLLARADRPKAQRILDQIETQVRRLPNSPKLVRVQEFKLQVHDDRILDLRILDEAVAAGRVGLVKHVRDEIRRLIGALPEE